MNKFVKEYVPYILIIIIIILIRTFIVTPVMVRGSSMDDTLKDGELMLLYKRGNLKRESIVVIDKKVEGSTLIKRIIALPGETIECTDGIIYINDRKYDDTYASNMTDDFEKITLKDNEYYVLGDNRKVSKDSRVLGPIKENNIKGTVSIAFYPFNRLGKVK